jgi:hypothetical protein
VAGASGAAAPGTERQVATMKRTTVLTCSFLAAAVLVGVAAGYIAGATGGPKAIKPVEAKPVRPVRAKVQLAGQFRALDRKKLPAKPRPKPQALLRRAPKARLRAPSKSAETLRKLKGSQAMAAAAADATPADSLLLTPRRMTGRLKGVEQVWLAVSGVGLGPGNTLQEAYTADQVWQDIPGGASPHAWIRLERPKAGSYLLEAQYYIGGKTDVTFTVRYYSMTEEAFPLGEAVYRYNVEGGSEVYCPLVLAIPQDTSGHGDIEIRADLPNLLFRGVSIQKLR